LTDENKIIAIGCEMINILFAPLSVKYTKSGDVNVEQEISKSDSEEEGLKNNISIDVFYSGQILGNFDVQGIQFPQFIEQYKEMAKIISQILGVSLANARKYQIIKEQKSQIEKYSEELKVSNDTKDKFFSIIAHDLKGPFNNLLGYSELLNEDLDEDNYENVKDYVSNIDTTLNDTFNLLVNLLEWAYSQRDKIEFTPQLFSLNKVANNVVHLLISQAKKKNIRIEVDIVEDFDIVADLNMLSTIFRNLISNAIKFTPNSGTIKVSAIRKNDLVQICIQDDGVGIAPESIDKLFALSTNESKRGTAGENGTGLGLILCKELVNSHHGSIWVESELEKGSRFYFTIPVSAPSFEVSI
jgi:signal transduction histidine kinase